MVEQTIKEKVASILEIPVNEVDLQKPLTCYGIDSLKAIEIQTFIEDTWKVDCSFESILNDITLSEVIAIISISKQDAEAKNGLTSNQSNTYPLSYQQLGIRRFDYTSPDKRSYNIGKAIEIHSPIDEKRFELCLNKIMLVHPSLRSYFEKKGSQEEQIVKELCQASFKYIEHTSLDNLNSILEEFALEEFNINVAPLFRTLLVRLTPDSYILLIVFHHIIADLWSIGTFFNQLFQIYHKEEISFNAERTYEKFVEYQNEYLHSEKAADDLNFWLQICQQGDHIINLPYDCPRKGTITYSGKHHTFHLSTETSQKLKEVAQEQKTTPFVCLLAAFELLIHFYSGQSNFFVGTTLPGRLYSKWHSCIGLFANILPVKVQIDPADTFSDYVSKTKEIISKVFEHSEMPFTYLLEQLSQRNILHRDINHSPIFQAMFVFQQVPSLDTDMNALMINPKNSPKINKYGSILKGYPWNIPVSPFELSLYMNEYTGQFQGCFEYNTELFFPSTIQLASEQYVRLLEELLENQSISPSSMNNPKQNTRLSKEECDKENETIISLFKTQVKQHPDHILVADKTHTLTLKGADDLSAIAARVMCKHNVKSESIVAVLMDHSPEMIIVILAILKLGAILLPLDPHMPEKRIKDILSESGASLLISDDIRAPSLMNNVLLINKTDFIHTLNCSPSTISINSPCFSSSIAYIIYTSGSTGKPKGIAVSHRSLISYLNSIIKKYNILEPSHWALHSPISFDLTLTSLFLPIVAKHTLHTFSRKIEDVYTLFQDILRHTLITHIKLTPSHLKFLNEIEIQPLSLKQLIVGGEQLTIQLVESIWKHYGKRVEIINEYGPTETTIGTIYGIFPQSTASLSYPTMLVDQCLDNADFIICDKELHELPPNLTGELFLSGTCLAYGYWNRPELTAESFIPHPRKNGKRMYKTGDLTRQLPDLSLLLLGRIDRQVKIHGFRIETEEIERIILTYPQVKTCTVALFDKISKKVVEKQLVGSDPALCAYVVPNEPMDVASLQQFLTPLLPHYMRPSLYVICENIQLSVNGKVDYTKLPKPEETQNLSALPPQTNLQAQLLLIWNEVLRNKNISVNQHFFELGGDSISVIEVVGKCKSSGLYFTPKDLYEHPTIELLAIFLDNASVNRNPSQDLTAPYNYDLSPIQHRFFSTQVTEPNHYNHAAILTRKEGFNYTAIKMALESVVNHHDILRSTFIKQNNAIVGHVSDLTAPSYHLLVFDAEDCLIEKESSEILNLVQKRIDIHQGPLICAALYKNEGQDLLLIVIHHLVIDGISWRIFLEDFDQCYSAASFGKSLSLQKSYAYPTWIKELHGYLARYPEESAYWDPFQQKLPQGLYKIANRRSLHFVFSDKIAEGLLSSKAQIYDTLLIALSRVLPACTGNQNNVVLLESHGRNSFSSNSVDVTRTIGWFTALFPIVLENHANENLVNLSARIRNVLRAIPNNGLGYQLFTEKSNDHRLPSICFNYLGQFDFQNYENFHVKPILNDLISENEQTSHHLELIVYCSQNAFHLTIHYDSGTYQEAIIQQFVQQYQDFLDTLCDQAQEIEAIAPLSPMQQGMLFEELRFPGEYYIEQALLEFTGNYLEDQWKKAFAKLISQFDALRAVFIHAGLDTPRQVIFKTSNIEIVNYDISTLSLDRQCTFIDDFLKKDKRSPFDLSQGPLMRLAVILTSNQKFHVVWSFHHIILDGWSLTILFKSLMEILQDLHTPPVFPAIDYFRYLENMDKRQTIEYYKTLLSGYHESVKLPKRLDIPNMSSPEVNEVSFVLPHPLVEKLQSQAQTSHTTLNTLLQTAWGVLVGLYSNCTDVVFGMVSSGRTLSVPNIGSMVGLFIATLPVRITFDRNIKFSKLCETVQKQIFQTQQQLNISLAEIQSLSPLKQNLFDHLFIFENYPLSGKAIEIVKNSHLPFNLTKASLTEEVPYNLTVTVLPGSSYTIHIKYNQASYADQTIKQLANNWQYLLNQIAIDPTADLSCLSIDEHAALMCMNNTEIQHPLSYIHTLFDNQLKRSPDSIAVVFGKSHISYGELNRRASILSRFLQHQCFGAEDLIGIFIDRSIEMVICWLAILKAGCAYVPLNTNEPIERLQEIVKETDLSLILTQEKHQLPASMPTLCVDSEWDKIAQMHEIPSRKTQRYPLTSLKNLAYVIYTSGSTGKPKGIAMEHASVVNHIHWLSQLLGISKHDRMLQCTDFSFDITICSFYGLFVGGVVVLVPPEVSKGMVQIYRHIKREKISLVQLGASLLGAMVHEEIFHSSHDLRYILCGGSPLKKETLHNWCRITHAPIMNLYGPTETCIDASYHQCSLKDLSSISVPIGKLVDNYQGFILNSSLDLCPMNAQGELYIGGAGVARGYYSRPDLTAESFLPHLTRSSRRMYKTGDICSWNTEQELILHGRSDHQVKIRGLRVELKEIENVLLEIKYIKQAFVHLTGEGINQKITAYLIATGQIDDESIRKMLSNKLPSHMIPSFYMFLDNFPLNERQKIDISKLPLPLLRKGNASDITTLTTVEKELQTVWARVLTLKAEEIYINDNFFDLGGNSLLLMQLQNQVQKTFSKSVSLDSFFHHPTIKAYGAFLRKEEEDTIDLQPLDLKKEKQRQYRNNRKALLDKNSS